MSRLAVRILVICQALFPWTPIQAGERSERTPSFTEYPAAAWHGPKPPLHLTKDTWSFRSTYRDAYRSKPNFAGHYGIAIRGCGSDCANLFVVDQQTGKVVSLNIPDGELISSCYDNHQDIDKDWKFQLNSRLMMVKGSMYNNADELFHDEPRDNKCGVRYYLEKNGKMKLIGEIHLKVAP